MSGKMYHTNLAELPVLRHFPAVHKPLKAGDYYQIAIPAPDHPVNAEMPRYQGTEHFVELVYGIGDTLTLRRLPDRPEMRGWWDIHTSPLYMDPKDQLLSRSFRVRRIKFV